MEKPFPDRSLQLALLERLKEAYPEVVDVQGWPPDSATVTRNLSYLHEHGLVELQTEVVPENWTAG